MWKASPTREFRHDKRTACKVRRFSATTILNCCKQTKALIDQSCPHLNADFVVRVRTFDEGSGPATGREALARGLGVSPYQPSLCYRRRILDRKSHHDLVGKNQRQGRAQVLPENLAGRSEFEAFARRYLIPLIDIDMDVHRTGDGCSITCRPN
jgi:hypothetical protein